MIFRCFDLETTSPDPATCEVVQAASVEAPAAGVGIDLAAASSRSMLFNAAHIPMGAQRVHGITPEMVADAPPFSRAVRAFVSSLIEPGVVAVSFNGCKYDVPIVSRYSGIAETLLRAQHIDVMRLWLRVKCQAVSGRWECSGRTMPLTSDMFAGSLIAAHGFFFGAGFDSAHDAAVDCRRTLAVLDAMLREGFVADVEQAIRWSNEPLPGDVDFDGKFAWEEDRCVITFGKFKGSPIEQVDRGFLSWMLRQDFGADTKDVVRRFLAGEYPQRAEGVA